MNETREERLGQLETTGSVFWFFMDTAWMLGSPVVALAIAAPTVLTNLAVFRYTERRLVHYAVTAAMNAWLLMNMFWIMADESIAGTLLAARVCAVAGILCLLAAFVSSRWRKEAWQVALRRFRRLRISR